MNTLLKWFYPKTTGTHKKTNNRRNGRKMESKSSAGHTGHTSAYKTIKTCVLFVSIALISSVIFNNYPKLMETIANRLNVELKPQFQDKPIEDKPLRQDFKPKVATKPSDMSSCAVFLDHIQSLSLDDFEPIDNQNAKDLTLKQISTFNNLQLGPRLQSIVRMDYFKFVKLNLHRRCTLWSDTTKCVLKDCSIQYCDESQLPKSIIMEEKTDKRGVDDECPTDSEQKLSQIDRTVPSTHIEAMNTLFDCTEDDSEGAQYYDLVLNPERFTGYSGETCDRIWRSIYEENCFLQKQNQNPFSLDSFCYEERIFYRAISGLHTSINIHLSALYHMIDGSFSHNTKEFVKRFNGKTEYLKNLYFVYLIELRALHKSEPYLLNRVNWQSSGDQSLTKEAIKDLLRTVRKFKYHFNESILFSQQPPTVAQEFASHFHNITTNIMDCVACDKCRLWGKVQTHGLSTAIKILMVEDIDKLKLHRHEITCLVNALARLSNSIAQIEVFNKLITNNKN